MRIGFTGTSRGMSGFQKTRLAQELSAVPTGTRPEFHHGDCVGSDAEAAAIARDLGYRIVGHPPVNALARAFFPSDEEWEPQPYLVRDHDIVDVTDRLIAAPRRDLEVLRSGTWATIRYARKINRPLTLLSRGRSMKTSLYICADGTLTYGPYGGRKKIIPQALPVAVTEDEDAAKALVVRLGRRAYDDPRADPDFKQVLGRRVIQPGYGPDHRYYYSGSEFVQNDVSTVFKVREAIKHLPGIVPEDQVRKK